MTTLSHTYAITRRHPIDLTLSENPLGPSPRVIRAIICAAENIHLYPHEEDELVSLLAKHHNIAKDTIFLGAGANELLEDYLKVFATGKHLIVPSITFPESVSHMEVLQGSVDRIPLNEGLSLNLHGLLQAIKPETAFIHLCNPNNPTGIWTQEHLLLKLADASPVPLLISEAGADFAQHTMIRPILHPNIIIVRSLSKAYGLAGLRIGYSVASSAIIAKMKRHLRSYRINSLVIAAAIAALQDQEHLRESLAYVLREKNYLMQEMLKLGFNVIPSQGQTFIAEVPQEFISANHFCHLAESYGVAILNCTLYEGLHTFIRISPQKHSTNEKFISVLTIMKEKHHEHH